MTMDVFHDSRGIDNGDHHHLLSGHVRKILRHELGHYRFGCRVGERCGGRIQSNEQQHREISEAMHGYTVVCQVEAGSRQLRVVTITLAASIAAKAADSGSRLRPSDG
jgi:hypothetical protein